MICTNFLPKSPQQYYKVSICIMLFSWAGNLMLKRHNCPQIYSVYKLEQISEQGLILESVS